jgi:hypothetical protein
MSTHVTTRNPVRSDVTVLADTTGDAPARRSRAWAFAGIGAGLAGIATIVTTSMVDAVYDPAIEGDTRAITEKLSEQTTPMLAFHSIAVVGALLMIVFAAGLFRRLSAMTGSIVPMVAFAGLAGTSVVSVLGSGLDTEFAIGFLGDNIENDSSAVFYNHWIGTIPWVWVLAGLSGLALFSAFRQGFVPRWIGLVGLVLGGLTVVAGVSPFEYIAGATGSLWLLVTAIGLTVGDRAYRSGR